MKYYNESGIGYTLYIHLIVAFFSTFLSMHGLGGNENQGPFSLQACYVKSQPESKFFIKILRYVHFINSSGFLAMIDYMNVEKYILNNQERKTFLLDKKPPKLLITLPS